MNESLDMQKIKMQLTVQSGLLHALCVALSPAQRDTALAVFRAATEDAHSSLQKSGVAEEALDFYAELCTSLEDALQGHRSS